MDIPVILIVDDEPDLRKCIRKLLEPRFFCEIHEANDGEEAISFINGNKCDLMVIDIKMPKKGGLDVLDAARGLDIATLVFSGWDSEQVYNECKIRGAIEYIPKSNSIKVVYDKIVKELTRRNKYHSKV